VFVRVGVQNYYARVTLTEWGRNVLASRINIDGSRTQNRKVYVVPMQEGATPSAQKKRRLPKSSQAAFIMP